MSKSNELRELRKKSIPRGVAQVTPCIVERADGAILTDVDGTEWIDFSSGIAVTSLGHNIPEVVEAIKNQADKILHSCFHVSMYEGYIKLAERLNQLTPGNFEKKSMLINSGAEAVENAIKIAKHYTGRAGTICFDNAFHGRTSVAMALTSKVNYYKKGFGPFASEFYRVPFPYAYRLGGEENSQKRANEYCLDYLKKSFKTLFDPDSIAAIIFEPIQGEGGFVSADREFFQELREITQSHGILTIVDEIQTGFGKTGKMFASDIFDIDYDMITMAKSMGSGMPISAVTGRADIMDHPNPGALGGTYGGNPVACAASLATLDILERPETIEVTKRNGEIVREALEEFKEISPYIGDVRGFGMMRAFEIVRDKTTKEPGTDLANKVAKYCLDRHVSILTTGTYGAVVRLLPPTNIKESVLRKGLAIIKEGIQSLS